MRRTLYLLSLIVFLTSFGPPALTTLIPRSNPEAISIGEGVDLLTPFLVVGGVILLVRETKRNCPHPELDYSDVLPLGVIAFFSLLMTSGQGIHLSSNALSHFLTAEDHGSIYQLNYLYDEVISHYLWHIGAFGVSVGVAFYQLKYPMAPGGIGILSLLVPSVLYAFTFTFATIEGQTVAAILPFTVLAMVLYLIVVWKHKLSLHNRPVLTFFLLCCIFMLLGWASYAIIFRGFPSPLELVGSQ